MGPAWGIRLLRVIFTASLFCIAMQGFAGSGIPEPGVYVYGRVFNEGVLVTAGELILTLSPSDGGEPIPLPTVLEPFSSSDGEAFSYKVYLPLESAVGGMVAPGVIELPTSMIVNYQGVIEVDSQIIELPPGRDIVMIGPESRGTTVRLDFNVGALPQGDGDGDGQVTPDDADFLLRTFLDSSLRNALSDQQRSVMDANCDGVITPEDGQLIFEAFLGLRTLVPCDSPQNLLARGDLLLFGAPRLTVAAVQGSAASDVIIPIIISGAMDISAFGFEVNYSDDLEFVSLSLEGTVLEDWGFEGQTFVDAMEEAPGRLNVGGFRGAGMPLVGDATLLNLTMHIKASAKGIVPVTISNLIDGMSGASIVPGSVDVSNSVREWSLYQ